MKDNDSTCTSHEVYIFTTRALNNERLISIATRLGTLNATLVIPYATIDELALLQIKIDDLKAKGFLGKLIIDPYLFHRYSITLIPSMAVVHEDGNYVTANLDECARHLSYIRMNHQPWESVVND